MATVTPTVNNDVAGDGGSVVQYTWVLTTADSDGAPAQLPAYPDRTWTATGTFGGGTFAPQGSNDATNWFGLSDMASAPIGLTAAGMEQTLERSRWVRPFLTGSAGATVTVILVACRDNPLRT